jgi:predicted nucleic acid-binding protein
VVGTLGVLRDAAQSGLIDLADALAKLRGTNFRVSRALIDKILDDYSRS